MRSATTHRLRWVRVHQKLLLACIAFQLYSHCCGGERVSRRRARYPLGTGESGMTSTPHVEAMSLDCSAVMMERDDDHKLAAPLETRGVVPFRPRRAGMPTAPPHHRWSTLAIVIAIAIVAVAAAVRLYWVRLVRIDVPAVRAVAMRDAMVRTGDVVLFAGVAIESRLIELMCASPVSHAGVVFVVDGRACVWHIASLHGWSKVEPLEDVAARYPGEVFVRPLLGGGDLTRALSAFVDRHWGTPYRAAPTLVAHQLLVGDVARLPAPLDAIARRHRDHRRGWLCSSLVALAYAELGVLRLTRPPDSYLPCHWWHTSEQLHMLPPYRFGDTMRLEDC